MRQQYHFRSNNKGLLSWDVFRLIELSKNLPVIKIPLTEISELDEEFWFKIGSTKATCRNIIKHMKLIQEADLSYPIILCYEGRVMDGMHRVCKASLLGHDTIRAERFNTQLKR